MEYQKESLRWFYSLDLHARINIRGIFNDICGVDWGSLSFLFDMGEKIELLYRKLIKESIIKPIS